MRRFSGYLFSILFLVCGLLTGCTGGQTEKTGLRVVATTTIVGDVVKQIGGERIALTTLLPVGADPHTYEPRPQDVAAISDAQVIFINGLELEHSLEPVFEANASGEIVAVSEGVQVLPFAATGEEHGSSDPHTWMDPKNVMQWVENITEALVRIDPEGAMVYEANAQAYLQQLADLDTWIMSEIANIPEGQRKLVSDHQSLGYFAGAYGLEQVGLVISSLSTNASASAQDLAKLEEAVKRENVRSIFVEMSANDALASQVARDTGITLVKIYSGSLGGQESGAADYISYMRFNVNAIVNGLR